MKKEALIERYIKENLSYVKARRRMKATKHKHFIRKKEYLALRHNYYAFDKRKYSTKGFKKLKEKVEIRRLSVEVDREYGRIPSIVYRSSVVYGYHNKKRKEIIDARIWIHQSNKGRVEEDDLISRFMEAMQVLDFWGRIQRHDLELDERVDEDEICPNGARIGEWFGFLNFRRAGKTYKYKVRTGSTAYFARFKEVKGESWKCD